MKFGKALVRSAEEALEIAQGKAEPAREWVFKAHDEDVSGSPPAQEDPRK
ncbi:hypothetical protein SAMN05444398_11591 [Roseovarius pacificus]|uniref:Uncharacterized protein n=1 Tax=Roseovarius pacificus TaxID=337701 RepID=A0A1M7IIB4_9RHOB|nr:hypothetical protein [Roseovarius pacificus]GGO61094.1 hypothetical protein GCM10011315_37010 [Roseovarius pacificus]SHM40348.1 hypothetical protein SAMN05444398_11591 [Roseovarius pacificus]